MARYLCKREKCLKHVYCMSCLINYKHPLFEQYYAKPCNGSQQFMTTSLYPKRFTKASKPFPILHIFMGDWLPHRVIDWFFHIPFMCAVTMKKRQFFILGKMLFMEGLYPVGYLNRKMYAGLCIYCI